MIVEITKQEIETYFVSKTIGQIDRGESIVFKSGKDVKIQIDWSVSTGNLVIGIIEDF